MIALLVLSDVVLSFAAFLTAYTLRDKGVFRLFLDTVQPIDVYLKALPVAIIILVLTLYAFKAYERKVRIRRISELYAVSAGTTFWVLLIMAGSYLAKIDYSRIIVLETWLFTLVFVVFGRMVIQAVHRKAIERGRGRRRVLIVGAGRIGRKIAENLSAYATVGVEIVGFLDDETRPRRDVAILGGIDDLHQIVNAKNIDEVIFAHQSMPHEAILDVIAAGEKPDVRYRVVSSLFELLSGTVDINAIEDIPSLDVKKAQPSLMNRFVKRTFDIVASAFSLILLSLLFLVLAILVRLDSPGKAFFTQWRVGYQEKEFRMYKMRTMRSDVEKYADAPRRPGDDRITRIGRWLRRTSLDELPQLLNIFLGTMSFVGPRPEMPQIVATYTPWQRKRLEAKPGLTGLWQVLGRKDLPLLDNIEYDFYYINNQSFLLDLIILLKTVPLILFGRGAY